MAYVICWTSSPIIFSRHHCPYTQGHNSPSVSEVVVFILKRLSMPPHTPSGHLLESFSDHFKAQLLPPLPFPMFPTIMTNKYLGVILFKLWSKHHKCFLSLFFTELSMAQNTTHYLWNAVHVTVVLWTKNSKIYGAPNGTIFKVRGSGSFCRGYS